MMPKRFPRKGEYILRKFKTHEFIIKPIECIRKCGIDEKVYKVKLIWMDERTQNLLSHWKTGEIMDNFHIYKRRGRKHRNKEWLGDKILTRDEVRVEML